MRFPSDELGSAFAEAGITQKLLQYNPREIALKKFTVETKEHIEDVEADSFTAEPTGVFFYIDNEPSAFFQHGNLLSIVENRAK